MNENPISTEEEKTELQTPVESSSNQTKSLLAQSKTNWWRVSTIVLFVFSVLCVAVLGLYYSKFGLVKLEGTPPQTQISETPAPSMSTETSSSGQIRVGGLQIHYPGTWVPVFSLPKEANNIIYFAKDKQEVQPISNCAKQGSCGKTYFRVEASGIYAVWANYTVEAFIKQVNPDIKIDKLQKTTIDGHDGWAGYTDDTNEIYQIVLKNGQGFQVITAFSPNADNEMMKDFLGLMSSTKVTELQNKKPSEYSPKDGFNIKFTSSLKTEDTSFMNLIMSSLFAPKDSTNNFLYGLFVASVGQPKGVVGSPNYPKEDYLNHEYYLLTDNNNLKPGTYGTQQIQIVLSPASSDTGSYLADPKYCKQDGDCQYRSNFCTIGAFNQYHAFSVPWGCGPAELENLGNSAELQQQLGCTNNVEISYDSIKCISNSCQFTNPKPVCGK